MLLLKRSLENQILNPLKVQIMDNLVAFNETTLKRIPFFLVIVIILLLGLPFLGLQFGLNFNIEKVNHVTNAKSQAIESHIRDYLKETMFQSSACILAMVSMLLSFIQYRLSHNKIALIIGLSFFFLGIVTAFHLWFFDNWSLSYNEKINLDSLIWIFANSFSGLILMIGLILLLKNKQEQTIPISILMALITAITLIGFYLNYYATDLVESPTLWIKGWYLSQPYELLSVFIYLILILFLYPKTYRVHPNILTDCIFYISLIQIVSSLYLIVLSHAPYDSAYTISYFLKIVAYCVPFVCLLINYGYSYGSVLNTQKYLKIKQEELTYVASHDPLTHLYNRREFEELLDKSIANGLRNKNSLSLLLIDLDNFKIINDTFSHNQGDKLLKEFSSRLLILIRKGDILSRIGGDEFTLISPNLKSPSSARHLAERVLSELNSPYSINNKSITVTVSIGISIFPDDGITHEDLLRKADLALYKSKGSGKNTYNFYTDQMSHKQHRESEVESYLRHGLKNNEFSLHYQPKYNLTTQEIMGAEILLRWHNPVLGEVSPNEFIPIAESTGLIVEIGNWVLRKACEQAMIWSKKYHHIPAFSVNLSPLQLINSHFPFVLEKALRDFNYPPQFMEFEITENLLLEDPEEVNKVLNNISNLGIKLSLDDFGKGYSSLNRLKTLPIDTLKIDKDFISDIRSEHEKVVLVDIIIKLASELGMSLVAEGIETEQQLNYLISRKCPFGQGFYLSKPLSANAFAQLAYHIKQGKP
jgi:diguanylate cyclase (GGDEF)-like protein